MIPTEPSDRAGDGDGGGDDDGDRLDRLDPIHRFSDRVADYVRTRPGYPPALIRTLETEAGLGPGSVVADLGAGTGISSALLLDTGATVIAVEPNEAMRRASEEMLGDQPRFRAVDGTAEATGLAEASIDLATAGQAFHWFDQARARAELRRVLRPGGRVALFWNRRLVDATPFLVDYEALLRRWGTDYAEVDNRKPSSTALAPFFGAAPERFAFPNAQELDLDGLVGRLRSSSYVPGPDHPDHPAVLAEAERIFDLHRLPQDDGVVTILYETELFLGRLV